LDTDERTENRSLNRPQSPETDPRKYSQLIFDKRAKATQWWKDKSFQQMVLEQLDIHKQKINLDIYSSQNLTQNGSQTYMSVTLVQHNIGENLDDLGFHSDILDATPNAWSMKKISDKLDFIKIKNFCSLKGTFKRIKRQTMDLEKIYTKKYLIKDCYPHIQKNLKTPQ